MKEASRPDVAVSGEHAGSGLTIKRNRSMSPRWLLLQLGTTAALPFGIGLGLTAVSALGGIGRHLSVQERLGCAQRLRHELSSPEKG
ncbi:MAG: hypothetical protein IT515_07855 [Burkholderiales bacterium]|nr:hypothetical protein [Burkholderiales bacterium]